MDHNHTYALNAPADVVEAIRDQLGGSYRFRTSRDGGAVIAAITLVHLTKIQEGQNGRVVPAGDGDFALQFEGEEYPLTYIPHGGLALVKDDEEIQEHLVDAAAAMATDPLKAKYLYRLAYQAMQWKVRSEAGTEAAWEADKEEMAEALMGPKERLAIAEEKLQEMQHEVERLRKVAAWPEMFRIEYGGDDGWRFVDLAPLWERLPGGPGRLGTVEDLAATTGGYGRNLQEGIASLQRRWDKFVHVVTEQGVDGAVKLTAWSVSGGDAPVGWYVDAEIRVEQEPSGRLALATIVNSMIVADEFGDVEFADTSGGLGREISRWYQGWQGRQAIRKSVGGPAGDEPAIIPADADEAIKLFNEARAEGWYRTT